MECGGKIVFQRKEVSMFQYIAANVPNINAISRTHSARVPAGHKRSHLNSTLEFFS